MRIIDIFETNIHFYNLQIRAISQQRVPRMKTMTDKIANQRELVARKAGLSISSKNMPRNEKKTIETNPVNAILNKREAIIFLLLLNLPTK